jgi:hypothetical protein
MIYILTFNYYDCDGNFSQHQDVFNIESLAQANLSAQIESNLIHNKWDNLELTNKIMNLIDSCKPIEALKLYQLLTKAQWNQELYIDFNSYNFPKEN